MHKCLYNVAGLEFGLGTLQLLCWKLLHVLVSHVVLCTFLAILPTSTNDSAMN